jgi:proline dehydrogenase
MINRFIVGLLQFMPKKLVWIFSKRYIAGTELKDAIDVTRNLNKHGIKATMDLLGEFQTRAEKVEFYKNEYIRLIEESVRQGIDNSFSVKPTMFGMLLNPESCYENLRNIISKAASLGRFVRIDMEDTQCTTMEIDMYKKLLEEFPGHVGIVLQAYLKRTMDDIKALYEFDKGRGLINIRICKGIYNEPADLAFKNREEINQNYISCTQYMLSHNMYAAIATHDRKLIDAAQEIIHRDKLTNDRFEFQMLYGVTPELRKSIVDKGYTMRVYVPYGQDWYNYSTRRLRENPKMVSHIIKALFIRG